MLSINCPACACRLEYQPQSPYRPFCSERCKNLDFSQWANEGHSIAGSAEYDDVLSSELDHFNPERK